MKRMILTLAIAILTAALPATTDASGNQTQGSGLSQSGNARFGVNGGRNIAAAQIVIVQEPYNLGQVLFSGKYNLGQPKLTAANVAEKRLRLASLQRLMPPREREQIRPDLAPRLTNREMNALEYFLAVRFRKLLYQPPSWAKQDPPIKVVFSS